MSDIAGALIRARPTVSIMVQGLSRAGYLDYEKYRGMTLTAQGRRVARRIRSRHLILTQLGLSKTVVARDTEGIEHHLSPETLAPLEKLVGYWRRNPEQLKAALSARPRKGSA